jgi:hypothetical protein
VSRIRNTRNGSSGSPSIFFPALLIPGGARSRPFLRVGSLLLRRRLRPLLLALAVLLAAAGIQAASQERASEGSPEDTEKESKEDTEKNDTVKSGGLGRVEGGAPSAVLDLAGKLAGPDAEAGGHAALRLLQAVAGDDPEKLPLRAAHLDFLLRKLEPRALSAPDADVVSAERIASALGTWIAADGPPFSTLSEVLLPLVGIGTGELRRAVVGALIELSRHESAAQVPAGATPSPRAEDVSLTLSALRARILTDPPPSEAYIRDASRVLWALDGKLLIATLVAALALHEKGALEVPGSGTAGITAAVVLEELRLRVPISFPTSGAWAAWWEESCGEPLAEILAACVRRSQTQHVAIWKSVMRRVKETGDPDRVLLVIQETLEAALGVELRTAAVGALGEYAQWVRDIKVGGDPAATKEPEAEIKDRLLSRGVRALISVLRRKGFPLESPEVIQAALEALRQYQVFLERQPELLREVSELVAETLAELMPQSERLGARALLIEALRLAGALRVTATLGPVEAILQEESAAWTEDLELMTTAVMTLGRLLTGDMSHEVLTLLIDHFKRPRNAPPERLREFRRACVTALQSGARNPVVRSTLRAFYKELLEGMEKDLRFPAILGLGTLAQPGADGSADASALALLVGLLDRSDQFGPQELIAAIDSVAYIGGDIALAKFLPHLAREDAKVKDKVVGDHLWKKTVGLVEAGGLKVLARALEQLESLSLEDDSLAPIECAERLCEAVEIKALLSPEKSDFGGNGRLEPFWRSSLSLARVKDLLRKDEEARGLLDELAELLRRDPALGGALPRGIDDLASLRASIGRRKEVGEKLKTLETADPFEVVAAFGALLERDASVPERRGSLHWLYGELARVKMSARLELTVELWRGALSSEEGAVLWAGFPPRFRERYLARLKALESPRAPAPQPGAQVRPERQE